MSIKIFCQAVMYLHRLWVIKVRGYQGGPQAILDLVVLFVVNIFKRGPIFQKKLVQRTEIFSKKIGPEPKFSGPKFQ